MLGAKKGIGFAVHNRSTGWQNCLEPQRRPRIFYTKLSPICSSDELSKLRPSARVTMAEFLDALQQHKEVWSAVLSMSIVEFASSRAGRPHSETGAATEPKTRRTRVSDAQRKSTKGAIVSVLGNRHDGLTRVELAGQIADNVLATIGVKREELADNSRQPLSEFVVDKKIHIVGEK